MTHLEAEVAHVASGATAVAVLKALINLAIARQAEFADGAQRVYLHLLSDLDPALVRRACDVWALRPRAEFAPAMPDAASLRETVAELAREDAEASRRRALAPMPVSDDDGPRYFCLSCRDESSSFRPFWCPGTGDKRTLDRPARSEGSIVECGRTQPHGQHDYVARCECWQRNPVVDARRQRQHVKREVARTRRTA